MNKIKHNKIVRHYLQRKFIKFFAESYKFRLPDAFIQTYQTKRVNFGFNGLGELVYKRTYSRMKEDNTNEEWFETVRRVVEGTYTLLMYNSYLN